MRSHPTMSYEHIQYEVQGPVATIMLNRPKAFNAILPQLEEELHDALRRADKDRAVRASILTGSGSAFCAGYDMASDEKTPNALDPSGKSINDYMEFWWHLDSDIVQKL